MTPPEAEMRAILEELRVIARRLDMLATAEPHHGYGSIGQALDHMTKKARVLAGDAWTMSKHGFAKGSQRIGG